MAAVAGPFAPRHPSPGRRASHVRKAPTHSSSSYIATTAPIGLTIPDPYYGHEDTAKTCAQFISALFSCPELAPVPPSSATSPAPAPPPAPGPLLAHFIGYALHRTRLHACVTFTALYLLLRLKTRFPAARGSSGHRLFISAFMIASKVVCDDTYSNKSWCVVGQGMFSLKEINQMEREMCGYLEWQLNFDPTELAEFEAKTRKEYGGRGTARLAPLVIPTGHIPVSSRAAREASYAVKRDPVSALPSPPPSPPPTPDAYRSEAPSPASSVLSTPPSLDSDCASIASSATTVSSGFRRGDDDAAQPSPVRASGKGGPPVGFAFAAPTVW